MTSSIDDDQPAAEKTRSEPDRATTEAALRRSDHTTIDYSRFDAVEVPEEVVIERRRRARIKPATGRRSTRTTARRSTISARP